MQKRVARRLPLRPDRLRQSSQPRDRRRTSGCARTGSRSSHRRRHRPLRAADRAAEVPGRIVTMSSADVPLKGLVHLVEALAKLRTERDVRARLVVGQQAEAARPRSHRATSASPTPSVRQGHLRRRAGRPGRLGRGRLRPLAVRGLLAARRRGHGLRRPRWWPAGRRDPRGRRPRRRAVPSSSRPATRARCAGPRAGCWATRSCRARLGAAGHAVGPGRAVQLARRGREDRPRRTPGPDLARSRTPAC